MPSIQFSADHMGICISCVCLCYPYSDVVVGVIVVVVAISSTSSSPVCSMQYLKHTEQIMCTGVLLFVLVSLSN